MSKRFVIYLTVFSFFGVLFLFINDGTINVSVNWSNLLPELVKNLIYGAFGTSVIYWVENFFKK